jgi:hypothetical protein
MIKPSMQTKNLNQPDETRIMPNTTLDVVSFGDLALMKITLQPGWKWSEDIKPIAKTESCQTPHFLYGISGRLHTRMDDGTEGEFGPGEVQRLSPGHDAWVVGDEPFVGLDFQWRQPLQQTWEIKTNEEEEVNELEL